MTIAIAERVVARLVDDGAEAVVLVGSRAREDASVHSDVDLAAFGDGPQYRLEIDEGLLVSVGWATADEQRRRLYDPSWLGMHVPGWRQAVVLHDPEGLAAEIKHEAAGWDWSQVSTQCDAWVAAWVVGLAEEAHRLATALQGGDALSAAVQRSVITLRLPQAMAIRRCILYASENHLWDLVARELGPGWRQAQSSALGLDDDDLGASCRSALRLFELAAVEVRELFDDRQLAVVEHALSRSRNA